MLREACSPDEYFCYHPLNRGAGELLFSVLVCLACDYSLSDESFALSLQECSAATSQVHDKPVSDWKELWTGESNSDR